MNTLVFCYRFIISSSLMRLRDNHAMVIDTFDVIFSLRDLVQHTVRFCWFISCHLMSTWFIQKNKTWKCIQKPVLGPPALEVGRSSLTQGVCLYWQRVFVIRLQSFLTTLLCMGSVILQKKNDRFVKSKWLSWNFYCFLSSGTQSILWMFRFMWFSFTAVGAVTTCIIIVSLWEKFQTNPTITGEPKQFAARL